MVKPPIGAQMWVHASAAMPNRRSFGEGPNTNTITVRVTDSSSPPLSEAKAFVVVVTPPGELKLSALILASGQLQLTLTSEPLNSVKRPCLA